MRDTALLNYVGDKVPCTPAPDFSRLTHLYRWMEWFSFGPFLWRCRCAFLPELRNRQAALILGDGDGRFTARLLHEDPNITIEAVDASDAMLIELTRRAASNARRLRTVLADVRVFAPSRPTYDLVATHFFLDCLTTGEVEQLAARLRRHASKNACWVVSEFAVPRGSFGHLIAQPLIALLYLAFGWLTGLKIRSLPNHRQSLRDAGWSLDCERKFLGGLLVSELWRPD